ncbi:MAG: hypothetical protein HZC28_18950 [Spirochaetes bacterium]|nr:hypothetical protein [Spirochaetota bacterium]
MKQLKRMVLLCTAILTLVTITPQRTYAMDPGIAVFAGLVVLGAGVLAIGLGVGAMIWIVSTSKDAAKTDQVKKDVSLRTTIAATQGRYSLLAPPYKVYLADRTSWLFSDISIVNGNCIGTSVFGNVSLAVDDIAVITMNKDSYIIYTNSAALIHAEGAVSIGIDSTLSLTGGFFRYSLPPLEAVEIGFGDSLSLLHYSDLVIHNVLFADIRWYMMDRIPRGFFIGAEVFAGMSLNIDKLRTPDFNTTPTHWHLGYDVQCGYRFGVFPYYCAVYVRAGYDAADISIKDNSFIINQFVYQTPNAVLGGPFIALRFEVTWNFGGYYTPQDFISKPATGSGK